MDGFSPASQHEIGPTEFCLSYHDVLAFRSDFVSFANSARLAVGKKTAGDPGMKMVG